VHPREVLVAPDAAVGCSGRPRHGDGRWPPASGSGGGGGGVEGSGEKKGLDASGNGACPSEWLRVCFNALRFALDMPPKIRRGCLLVLAVWSLSVLLLPPMEIGRWKLENGNRL